MAADVLSIALLLITLGHLFVLPQIVDPWKLNIFRCLVISLEDAV